MKIAIELSDPDQAVLDQLVKATSNYYTLAEKLYLAEYDQLESNRARLVFVDKAMHDELQEQLRAACANSLAGVKVMNLKDFLPKPEQVVVLKMVDHLREVVGLFTTIPRQEPGNNPSMHHLVWMLDQIQWDTTQSLTKKHRWIGYIQGVLIERGIMDMTTERNITRDILRGH